VLFEGFLIGVLTGAIIAIGGVTAGYALRELFRQ